MTFSDGTMAANAGVYPEGRDSYEDDPHASVPWADSTQPAFDLQRLVELARAYKDSHAEVSRRFADIRQWFVDNPDLRKMGLFGAEFALLREAIQKGGNL